MPPASEPTLLVQAAPARPADQGRNVVRLPRKGLRWLRIAEGDPVVIETGGGVFWARALAAHEEDEDTDAARLDATAIGCSESLESATVRIRAATIRGAFEIVVDIQDVGEISRDSLRESLARVPSLLPGDRIPVQVEGETTEFDADVALAGLSLVRVVGQKEQFVPVSVRIEATVPAGPVHVEPDTELRFRT